MEVFNRSPRTCKLSLSWRSRSASVRGGSVEPLWWFMMCSMLSVVMRKKMGVRGQASGLQASQRGQRALDHPALTPLLFERRDQAAGSGEGRLQLHAQFLGLGDGIERFAMLWAAVALFAVASGFVRWHVRGALCGFRMCGWRAPLRPQLVGR